MAVLKIHVIRHRLDDRLKYAINPEKTAQPDFPNLNGLPDTLTDAFNCYCDSAYEDMTETKKFIGKEGNVLGYHFIQSFKPGEVTPAQAHDIGIKFIERCFANDYQVVIGTHTDKDHIHNHIIVNSVSFETGKKYRSTPETFYALRGISDEICRAHGLSVIENPKSRKGKHYAEWKADQEYRPTIRAEIRKDIDIVLMQARTLDEFWNLLRKRGYDIRTNPNRKYVAIRPPNGKRYIRLKSLGDNYTPGRLSIRIENQRGNIISNLQKLQQRHEKRKHRKKYYPLPYAGQYRLRLILFRTPRITFRGIRALYWRYVYMLGKVRAQKAPRAVRGMMIEELKKLEQYKRQYYFLRDNRLNTKNDICLYREGTENEIYVLTDRRKQLYRTIRQSDEEQPELREQIAQINAELRELRKKRKLCDAVIDTAPEMKIQLHEANAVWEQIDQKEKIKKGAKAYEPRECSNRPNGPHDAGYNRNRRSFDGERSRPPRNTADRGYEK